MIDDEKLIAWLESELDKCKPGEGYDACDLSEVHGERVGYQRTIFMIKRLKEGKEI